MTAQIPEDLADLLTTDVIGNVTAKRPDGSLATYLMWVDWDGQHADFVRASSGRG
jgi:hypothetical protein